MWLQNIWSHCSWLCFCDWWIAPYLTWSPCWIALYGDLFNLPSTVFSPDLMSSTYSSLKCIECFFKKIGFLLNNHYIKRETLWWFLGVYFIWAKYFSVSVITIFRQIWNVNQYWMLKSHCLKWKQILCWYLKAQSLSKSGKFDSK